MKKISILLLLTLMATSAIAQYKPRRSIGKLKINWYKSGWFLEANGGVRLLGQASNNAEMKLGPSANAGLGYFFNEKIAVKGRLDYNQFAVDYTNPMGQSSVDRSFSVGASAEVVVRLLQVFSRSLSRDFALNFHAGAGLTSLINPSYREYYTEKLDKEFDDPFIKGADDMGHVIVGIMPQYHLNSRVSINLDISHFTQFKQHKTYDTHSGELSKDVTGIISATVGLTFRP